MKLQKKVFMMSLCSLFVLCTSCDTTMAVLAGMAGGTNSYYGGATMTNGYTPSTSSSYSSAVSSSSTTCRRCGGSGLCQTCKGAGKVYDWGPASITSKTKYTHKCSVCNGTGKCSVCH